MIWTQTLCAGVLLACVGQKRIMRLLIILSVVLLAAGCGGGSPSPPPSTAEYPPQEAPQADMPASDGQSVTEISAVNQKIIKNAHIEIESESSTELYNVITEQMSSLGGYESSLQVSNFEEYTVINAEIKIPSDMFDQMFDFIVSNSDVVNSSMDTQDITEEYFDVQTRMETKREMLKTYYKLLENASSVDEIIQLQTTIDDITLDLEAMEGRLKLWNSQVNMSTISLLIRQYNDPVKIRKDIDWNALSLDDMGYLIKRGFSSTLVVIVKLIQWLLIGVLSVSPILLLLGMLVFIYRRKKAKRSKEEPRQDIDTISE